MTDDKNEETFRPGPADGAGDPTSGPGRPGTPRRLAFGRATAVGGVLALAVGAAAAVSVVSGRPGGPVIVAQPSERADVSEAPQQGTAGTSPSPDDQLPTRVPDDAGPSPTTAPASEVSPSEPRPTRSPEPTPSGPAQSPGTTPAEPASTASEGVDHGAPLWGRKFLVVEVTEDGEVTHVPPEDDPWITHFSHQEAHEPSHGGVGWRWGCNPMGGSIRVTADRLILEFMGSTAMYCDERGEDRDAWSIEFFESDPYWRLEGDRLWLWTESAVVELEEDRTG